MSCSLEEPSSTTTTPSSIIMDSKQNQAPLVQAQQSTLPMTQTITLSGNHSGNGGGHLHYHQQVASATANHLSSISTAHMQQQHQLITLQPPQPQPQSQPLQIIQPNTATYTTLSNAASTATGATTGSSVTSPLKMQTTPATATATTATPSKLANFVITTLGSPPVATPQKLVTLTSSHHHQHHHHQPATATVTIINSNSATAGSVASSSAIASSSASSTSADSQQQQQQQQQPTTTTITLTSPSPQQQQQNSVSSSSSSVSTITQNGQSTTNSSTILFPLQQSQQQYTSFIDTGSQLSTTSGGGGNTTTTSVNLFSPLGSSTNSYYTFQPTSAYNPQQTIITTTTATGPVSSSGANSSSSSSSSNTTNNTSSSTNQGSSPQQQQSNSSQPQQTLYVMYDTVPPPQSHQQQQQQANSNDLDNGQIDFEGHVSHTAQAAPITVQWLIDNFEPAEGCSLRRSTLYNYYLLHCTEQRIEPVNPASFGKLIRSVFLGLRTRRLGTRGNSKYHYYGIRLKMSSPLNQIAEDNCVAIRNHPLSLSPNGAGSPSSPAAAPPPSKRVKTSSSTANAASNVYESIGVGASGDYKPAPSSLLAPVAPPQSAQIISVNNDHHHTQPVTNLTTVVLSNGNINNPAGLASSKPPAAYPANITKIVKTPGSSKSNGTLINDQEQQQTSSNNHQDPNNTQTKSQLSEATATAATKPGDATANGSTTEEDVNQIPLSIQMPDFGSIQLDGIELPPNCTLEDVKKFEELYRQHCEKILDSIVGLNFQPIQSLWMRFWRSSEMDTTTSASAATATPTAATDTYEEQLSSERFFALCECARVYDFVTQCDFHFYQFCIEILIPDVFGMLPHNLVTLIRNLSKTIEGWLVKALHNVPERLRAAKLAIIRALSMILRRYTSLNHLIHTVTNTFQNEGLLAHMSIDINKVDFGYIREQLRWTCDWESVEEIVNRFETDFKDALRKYDAKSMESWLTWIDDMVTTYMQQHEHDGQSYSKTAKSFIPTWYLICDSTVRDLTLRSAPTFGSFHLVRLLFGEYINYLIAHKIAHHCNKPLLQIMCPSLLTI